MAWAALPHAQQRECTALRAMCCLAFCGATSGTLLALGSRGGAATAVAAAARARAATVPSRACERRSLPQAGGVCAGAVLHFYARWSAGAHLILALVVQSVPSSRAEKTKPEQGAPAGHVVWAGEGKRCCVRSAPSPLAYPATLLRRFAALWASIHSTTWPCSSPSHSLPAAEGPGAVASPGLPASARAASKAGECGVQLARSAWRLRQLRTRQLPRWQENLCGQRQGCPVALAAFPLGPRTVPRYCLPGCVASRGEAGSLHVATKLPARTVSGAAEAAGSKAVARVRSR